MLSRKSGLVLSLATGAILLLAASASAHCDRFDGPVAADARAALENSDFDAIAVWVSPSQTDELHNAYEQTRAVRVQSTEAQKLADRWFIETAVRLHREAEGMPYSGVKPAGLPVPPDVAAADRAYESGEVAPVTELLKAAIEEHVRDLFNQAMETKETKKRSVENGREAVDDYVRFIAYVHGLYEKIQAGPEHGVGDDHAALSPPPYQRGDLMHTTYANRTVGDIVTEQPGRSRVFEDFGIDYCCGGNRPLAEACAEKGIEPQTVIERLKEADAARSINTSVDYGAMSLTALVDHIVQTHHAYLNEALPRANQLAAKVAQAHAASPKGDALKRLENQVRTLTDELRSHMMKEETVLFPAIKRLDAGEAGMVLDGPVAVMMQEHESAGRALTTIRTLTDDFTLPEWGCNTYRAMLDALAELEQDLHQHIHKENNVLFPRAQQSASADA